MATRIGVSAVRSAYHQEWHGTGGALGYIQVSGAWNWRCSRFEFHTNSPMKAMTIHIRWSGGTPPEKPWAAVFEKGVYEQPDAYDHTNLAIPLANPNRRSSTTVYFDITNLTADIYFQFTENLPAGDYYVWVWPSNPAYGSSYYHTVNNVYTGDQELYVDAETAGFVYIDSGSGFGNYGVYIDNGSGFARYLPYIDNGTGWTPYLG